MPLQKDQTLSSLQLPNNLQTLSGSAPQTQPAPPLIFNHKAKKSSKRSVQIMTVYTYQQMNIVIFYMYSCYVQIQIA